MKKFLSFLFILILLAAGTAGYFVWRYKKIPQNRQAYLLPSQQSVKIIPLISAGNKIANGYRMAGTPDGLGAFDNGNKTFTLLVNHELLSIQGKARAHGGRGAFISRWMIQHPYHPKNSWKVTHGEDAIKDVYLWNPSQKVHVSAAAANLSKLCSATLSSSFAFSFVPENVGTNEKIYLTGEEHSIYGRAFALVATGPGQGKFYELPAFGNMAFENVVPSPYAQKKTVVIALDDAPSETLNTLGEVYVYVGDKTASGNDITRAGLTNGQLFGIAVEELPIEDAQSGLGQGRKSTARFRLKPLGDLRNDNGEALFTLTKANNPLGVTKFLRPEDGAWLPSAPGIFYFATTGAKYHISEDETQTGPGRLWELHFDDIEDPFKGGTITLKLDGSEGVLHPDNITVTKTGEILIQEDAGNKDHLGRIWLYNTRTDKLNEVAHHNPRYFSPKSRHFISKSEESSGIIDASNIIGPGWYLTSVQSPISFHHWHSMFNRWRFGYDDFEGKEIVNDGQILAIYIPPGLN